MKWRVQNHSQTDIRSTGSELSTATSCVITETISAHMVSLWEDNECLHWIINALKASMSVCILTITIYNV